MDWRKTFVNPCKMYAKIKRKDVIHINGYKVDSKNIILYTGNSETGFKEERFALDDVEIFDWK